jgi:hypothetical protein
MCLLEKMRFVGFVFFLASWRYSFADVCTRLYELRFENIGRGLLLEVHPDIPPYCDHRDLCVGFVTATTGQLLSCGEAFRRLMKHQERFIHSPPIIQRIENSVTLLIADYKEYLLLAKVPSVDSLMSIHVSFRGLVQTMESSVSQIIQYMANNFPRMYYDDDNLGHHLRTLTNAVNSIVQNPLYKLTQMNVRKYIFRSCWMNKWASYGHILLQSIVHAPFDEIELMIISFAPIMHAFLHMSTTLGVYHPDQFTGYLWVLSAIVRYDPLYVVSEQDRVWFVSQGYFRNWENSPAVPVDSGIDFQSLKTSMWDPQELFPDSPMDLRQMVLRNVHEGNLKQLQKLMILARSIGEAKLFFDVDDDQKALIERELGDRSLKDDFTLLTLARIFRDRIDASIKFTYLSTRVHPFPRKDHERRLPIRYGFFGPCRDSLTDQIMQLDASDFSSIVTIVPNFGPDQHDDEKSPHARDVALLASFFDSDMFETEWSFDSEDGLIQPVYKLRFTTSLQRDQQSQTALGRILGIYIRIASMRKPLSQFIFAPSPTASVFETIFFNSYYVRKGVYDVIPTNMLEHLFSNGNQLVNALRDN